MTRADRVELIRRALAVRDEFDEELAAHPEWRGRRRWLVEGLAATELSEAAPEWALPVEQGVESVCFFENFVDDWTDENEHHVLEVVESIEPMIASRSLSGDIGAVVEVVGAEPVALRLWDVAGRAYDHAHATRSTRPDASRSHRPPNRSRPRRRRIVSHRRRSTRAGPSSDPSRPRRSGSAGGVR